MIKITLLLLIASASAFHSKYRNYVPFEMVPTVTYSCSDCKTLKIVFSERTEGVQVSCGTLFCSTIGGKGQCVKENSCDLQGQGDCNPATGSPPRLPNPDNCTQFLFCRNKEYSSFNCVKGQVFDAERSTCVSGGVCHNITCSTTALNPVQYKAHPGSPRLFVECVYLKKTTVHECDKAENDPNKKVFKTFDATLEQCLDPCLEEGNFLIKGTNCTKFMECSKNSKTAVLERKIRDCPVGEIFWDVIDACVPTDDGECEEATTTTLATTESTSVSTTSTKKPDENEGGV